MVQGTGLYVLVERAISLNRPLRTRTVGGVGAGGEKPLATRLATDIGFWNCTSCVKPRHKIEALMASITVGFDLRQATVPARPNLK